MAVRAIRFITDNERSLQVQALAGVGKSFAANAFVDSEELPGPPRVFTVFVGLPPRCLTLDLWGRTVSGSAGNGIRALALTQIV